VGCRRLGRTGQASRQRSVPTQGWSVAKNLPSQKPGQTPRVAAPDSPRGRDDRRNPSMKMPNMTQMEHKTKSAAQDGQVRAPSTRRWWVRKRPTPGAATSRHQQSRRHVLTGEWRQLTTPQPARCPNRALRRARTRCWRLACRARSQATRARRANQALQQHLPRPACRA
jgi:hypothetical protein